MVYVILAQGFEEIEALTPIDLLRRVDIDVTSVSLTNDLYVQGGHEIIVKADISIDQIDFDALKMLVLPGGLGGVKTMADDPVVMNLILKVFNAGKKLAAICAAPTLLAKLGILKSLSLVCHPSVSNEIMNAGGRLIHNKHAVCDQNLITGKAAGSSLEFALEIITNLLDRETAEQLRCAIT